MTTEQKDKPKQIRVKRRGDPDNGVKEALGIPLITRVPIEDILHWNYLSKRPDLGFRTTIELARSVFSEFIAAAPWANPAVRDDWRWMKPLTVTHKDRLTGARAETGYAQFNVRIPASERDAVVEVIDRLAATDPSVTISSFVLTAVHWATHFRYPRGGPMAPAQLPYSPANFAVSAPLVELPAMHVTETKARKLLAALGDADPVTTAELPNRLLTAIQAR